MNSINPIVLHERSRTKVDRVRLPVEDAELLKQKYGDKITVEMSSFRPDSDWQLTSQDWVGYIPLTPKLSFCLLPKNGVEITDLFEMLEYAYNLNSFQFFEKDYFDCETLEAFYDKLASILADQILDRSCRGFYHSYQPRSDQLPYLRGRIDLRRASLRPWDVKFECHFEEYISDIEDNQILAWTLLQILRSGLCTENTSRSVSHAFRRLLSFAKPEPCAPESCINRTYHSLNDDYRSMHALCRLFLEHIGPAHRVGSHEMIPYVVNMSKLYERFVAEWLKEQKIEGFLIEAQEDIKIDPLSYTIDLVLRDESTKQPKCVMDTKYKVELKPNMSDINQVIAYAVAIGCRDAILIYPVEMKSPIDMRVGDIHVRSATFALEGGLSEAGRKFITKIVEWMRSEP